MKEGTRMARKTKIIFDKLDGISQFTL